MGHPLGPGRSGSGVGGVTDQAIKPTMAARITPVTKRGELKKDILKTGRKATVDDVETHPATDLNTPRRLGSISRFADEGRASKNPSKNRYLDS